MDESQRPSVTALIEEIARLRSRVESLRSDLQKIVSIGAGIECDVPEAGEAFDEMVSIAAEALKRDAEAQ